MEKVYTLRVVVELFDEEDGELAGDGLRELRTQELTGDLQELCMMAPAVPHVAEGMTLAVLGAERRRQAVGDLPY